MAAYAGFAWHLPIVLHLLVVIIFGLLGGAIWGGWWACSRPAPARTR